MHLLLIVLLYFTEFLPCITSINFKSNFRQSKLLNKSFISKDIVFFSFTFIYEKTNTISFRGIYLLCNTHSHLIRVDSAVLS